MIPLAAVRPPPPEFRGTDKADFERQDAQRKALRNACDPIEIDDAPRSFQDCRRCPQTAACHAHRRATGRLLGICDAQLSSLGYSRKPVATDTLERRVLDALAGGGWRSSTSIYDSTLPERATMSENVRETEERRIGYAIKRLRDKQLVEMRIPPARSWTREYKLVEQAQ